MKTIKKISLLFAILLFSVSEADAQIISSQGLNHNAAGDASQSMAFIDGTSSPTYNGAGANYAGSGILFPRMDLTLPVGGAPFDAGVVGSTSYNPNYYDGLVVYNTGTGNSELGVVVAVAPGFYYFSNPGATAINTGTWLPLGSASAGKFIDGTDPLNAVYSAGNVGIGTDTPEGALDVASANSGVILPRVANVGSVTTPVNGTIVYDISSSCIRSYEGDAWSSCLSAGSNSSVVVDCDANGLIGTNFITDVALTDQAYSVTVTNDSFGAITFAVAATDVVLSGSALGTVVVSDVTVGGASATSVTLAVGASQLLTYTLAGTPVDGDLNINWSVNSLTCNAIVEVSVGDADFSLPLLSTIFSVNDGTPVVDVQGVVDNAANQIVIDVPYINGFGTYAAYTSAVVSNAAGTGESGDANGFSISYPAGAFDVRGSIPVTITVDGDGTFNATRQSFEAAELIAALDFQLKNESRGTIQLEVTGGIPDRNFADPAHRFLYTTIIGEDGNVWLSNNLGANYTNLDHAAFNPSAQATALNDQNAYGSYYQWGRGSEGHELASSPVMTGTSSPDSTPTGALAGVFLANHNSPWYTGTTPDLNLLWNANGTGVNNPCPQGFRVPSEVEMGNVRNLWTIFNATGALNSTLKLPAAGARVSNTGTFSGTGTLGFSWTSSTSGIINSRNYFWIANGAGGTYNSKNYGLSIRCIKN